MTTAKTIRRRTGRPAAAAVEFAIVLPILLLVVYGILEVGRLVQVMQVLHNAAREGARQASTATASLSEIKANVKTYIQGAEPSITNLNGYDLQYKNITHPSVTDPQDATQLDRFTVTVVLPYDNARWSPTTMFLQTGLQLQATVNWYSLRDLPVEVTTTLPVD